MLRALACSTASHDRAAAAGAPHDDVAAAVEGCDRHDGGAAPDSVCIPDGAWVAGELCVWPQQCEAERAGDASGSLWLRGWRHLQLPPRAQVPLGFQSSERLPSSLRDWRLQALAFGPLFRPPLTRSERAVPAPAQVRRELRLAPDHTRVHACRLGGVKYQGTTLTGQTS